MAVMVPVHDFRFESNTSTPYVSAPSSPKRFGDPFDYHYHYTSAPTSPTRAAAIYAHFNPAINNTRPPSPSTATTEPFGWDDTNITRDEDFEFDFSGQMEKGKLPPELTTADQLFEKGRIRPLKPPPRMQQSEEASSPRRPTMWSPRRKAASGGEELDPFTAAMVEVTRDRGRDTNPFHHSSSRSKKGSRSLSPFRGEGGILLIPPSPLPSISSPAPIKSGGGKKWRLRDLLLFRSASEGRATGNTSKDPLSKYSLIPTSPASPSSPNKRALKKDSKNSSFRSTDSNGSMRRGSGAGISAHEIHYTSNRAAAEESKKKTPLPYRQGLFGCLNFNPAINSIVKGFSSSSFSHSTS